MAATARPSSLGDTSSAKFSRIRESVEMPEGRENLIREFARILGIGMVQKVVVEVGSPILFERLVRDDAGVQEDLDKVDADDLYGVVRNAELMDFRHLGASPFEAFFNAFEFFRTRQLAAKAVMIHDWAAMRAWLGMDVGQEPVEPYGLPVFLHEQVPEDVLLFIGASELDMRDVKLTLRIPMDTDTSITTKAQKVLKEKRK